MRFPILLLPCLLIAAPVCADTLQVAKGMWSTSTDIYFAVTQDGEAIDIPPDHSTLDECWSTDEEVSISDSAADLFEGCVPAGSRSRGHSFDLDLACDLEGVPMSGTAQFAVNKAGDQFSARLFLSGEADGLRMQMEGLVLGYRTGTCSPPQ